MLSILTSSVLALAPAAPACMGEASAYRDFDFWIGRWEVFNPDPGAKLGDNTIAREAGGCVLIERWRSAGDGEGASLNFVDPETGRWRQVWVSSSERIDYEPAPE